MNEVCHIENNIGKHVFQIRLNKMKFKLLLLSPTKMFRIYSEQKIAVHFSFASV